MHVGIVLQNNFPMDREVRARKFAKSLSDAGANVSVFGRNSRTDPSRGLVREEYGPRTEKLKHATVVRYSWLRSTPLFGLVTMPIPFNPFWMLWLVVQFVRRDVDVVISSGLRAGPTAILAGKLLGIPVVIDLSENHSEFVKTLSKDSVADYVTKNTLVVRSVERFLYRFADHIWVVTEERRDVMPDYVESGRVSVVSNVPDNVTDTGIPSSDEFDEDGFRLVYVGILSEFRGLDRIIEAIDRIDETGENAKLVIAGDGPHKAALEDRTEALGMEDRVTFLGWIDSKDVPAFLASGDVGIVPHEVNSFTDTTIPNKLFDMMRAGLPVLATDMDPVAKIISEARCGWIVEQHWGPTQVGEVIKELKSSSEVEEMGANARTAIEQKYNWEQESQKVLRTIAEIT